MPLFNTPRAYRINRDTLLPSSGLNSFRHNMASQYSLANSQLSRESPAPARSSQPALPHLTLLVLEAVLEVVCVSLPGYIVARQGMFTAEMQKFTANLNLALFTPCLIFIKLASQLSVDKLVDLAIIPVIFIVQIFISYLCSLAVSRAFGFSKRPRNFIIAMGVFGNSNSLPISLVLSLSRTINGLHWDKIRNDNDDEVAARGILYLLIFQQLGQVVRWSWGYNVLLAPPDKLAGTDENTISNLENGEHGIDDERARLLDPSTEYDKDVHYGSGSDDTRVETGDSGLGSAGSSDASQTPRSGNQTPVIRQQHSLANSQNSSQFALPKHGSAPEFVATPTNVNVQPLVTSKNSHPSNLNEGNDDDASKGIKSLLVRCRAAARRSIQRTRGLIVHASQRAFRRLPGPAQRACAITSSALMKFGWGVWEFMNPPLWAMLAAIVVASIPDLQDFFFRDGTFFSNSVTSAISQSGGVAVPLILVVLGGNLARNTLPNERHTDAEDEEETKLLIASLISRMLLPLAIMAPLLAVTTKFIPVNILDDPIFVIVCFLITGAPSALQLAQICQINNVYMGTMSRLLFQSYVVWILPSTLILVMCALEVVKWAQQ